MHSPVPLRFFTQTCLGEVWRLELRRSGCYSYRRCLPPREEEKETTGLQSKAISHKLLPSPLLSVPSGSSVMLGMRNHCPLPMGKEDLAVQLGMGSISKITPACPISDWAPNSEVTYLLEDVCTVEKDTGDSSQEPLGPAGTTWLYVVAGDAVQHPKCHQTPKPGGSIPFFDFSHCIPPNQYKGLSTGLTFLHPETWGFISLYATEGTGHVRRNRPSRSCTTWTPFVSRLLRVVCNYV